MRKDRVFPVLAVFALMSSDCVLANFRAITEESPVVVAVGGTAVLHCRTSVPNELTEVRLIRIQDGRYSIINIFEHGKDQQRCDLPEYNGRTEVMRDGLVQGRAALKLFNVSVADEGTYRCFLQTVYYFDFGDLELRVTALGSDPKIDIEGLEDGRIKLVCKSEGWNPEPMLVNKHNDGEMAIRKEENGLYSVEYSRVLTGDAKRTFCCMLQTQFSHQERESSVYVADNLFQTSTNSNAVLYSMISLLLLLLLLVAVVILIIWARQRRKRGSGPLHLWGSFHQAVPS